MLVIDQQGNLKSILRSNDEYGFKTYDLVGLPRRLCFNESELIVKQGVDHRLVKEIETPANSLLKKQLPATENWLTISQRTLARLMSAFLLAEDPQRRLEARKAATLMHQVSLVQHILNESDLKKVLIGDEVGLGKTIEAGLLVQQLINRTPHLRVLYLAPARLVHNVVKEFREKLDIDARTWAAGSQSDSRLSDDKIVVASINKAVFGKNIDKVVESGPWDIIIVDECHHLSDWDGEGGKPNKAFKLVTQLIKGLPSEGRLILLSGTPHQGSEARFKNILRLLSDKDDINGASGRVIFRTKDHVRDWDNQPLFPGREIREPVVVEMGDEYSKWYNDIGMLYSNVEGSSVKRRAAGWAKSQALQWAASSVSAGLGFLVRLGIRRLNWSLETPILEKAISELRPYRGGKDDEPLPKLFERLKKQTLQYRSQEENCFLEDEESELEDSQQDWTPDPHKLEKLIEVAIKLNKSEKASSKWDAMCRIINENKNEKVVLFAQPVETVTVIADVLRRNYDQEPAIIIGNQSDQERAEQVEKFQSDDGPRFLVSSKAGGEGLNMQKARHLIHLDVPWNPMDLEQRIGRVHRFGSRKTVIINTIMVAGSREVDMYRIAREKLKLIAKNLEPDEFETIFSRVMSLVPPKELENVLGSINGPSSLFNEDSAKEIGKLVKQGYDSWSSFNESYRKLADNIKATNPGEATWADLAAFLVKFAGAKDAEDAEFGSFSFQNEEIVLIEKKLPIISLDGNKFACGDIQGSHIHKEGEKPIKQLGLNVREVQNALRESFSTNHYMGPAFIKLQDKLVIGTDLVALFCLRQKLEQINGSWSEKSLTLHVMTVSKDEVTKELNQKESSALIRACCNSSSRIKDPMNVTLPTTLAEVESQFIAKLCTPSEAEIKESIRYAVWPIAAVAISG